MPFSPKAQELQICSKQASIHELSTPTNKLATYFGDDKPTSRSVLSDKPLEIKPVIRRVAQCWYWIGIGFACVKHCETYRARGFTAANQGSSSRINHCEGAIIAAISHDEQVLPRDGRTGEQQLQMHVQQLQMDVQLCKYVCDNGFAHGAREIGAKMITNMEQENCVKDVSINDIIEKDVVKEMGNHVMINRINWKIREQDGFNPMKYVCKYMEQE